MKLKLSFNKFSTFAAAATMFAFSNYSSAALTAGKDYTVLNQPATAVPTVTMAMSFACTHCADFTKVYKVPQALETMVHETYPKNGEFNEFHVVFDGVPLYRDFGRLRAVLAVTDNDKFIPEAFELPYSYTNDPTPIKKWLETKLNASAEEVNDLWTSFSVDTYFKKQVEFTKAYEIKQTPTFIVNGKYVINLQTISFAVENPTPDQIKDAVVARVKELLLETTPKTVSK